MSFDQGAENIRVEDSILRCSLPKSDGSMVDAELDLNNVLGNNDGRFEWGSGGYYGSAQDSEFSIQGGASVPVLVAQLSNAAGEMQRADVNLAERIRNNDGVLEFN